jgi:hypothetical protein
MLKTERVVTQPEVHDSQDRGHRYLEHLDQSPQRSREMWSHLESLIIPYIPDEKLRDIFRAPSGNYMLDRLLKKYQFSQEQLISFVDTCTTVFEQYGEYEEIAKLWALRDEILRDTFKVHKPVKALSPYKDLYNRAMEDKEFRDAWHIAQSEMFQKYLQYFDTHSKDMQEAQTRALEEHAKDVLAAAKISLTDDELGQGWRNNLHLVFTQYLFLTYKSTEDSYRPERLHAMRKDGYASEHPSTIALEVARQYCEDYLYEGPLSYWKARLAAREARLDVHDPEYFADLMKKTSGLNTWVDRARMEFPWLFGRVKPFSRN